jgi:hypothetical protein
MPAHSKFYIRFGYRGTSRDGSFQQPIPGFDMVAERIELKRVDSIPIGNDFLELRKVLACNLQSCCVVRYRVLLRSVTPI